MKRRKRLLGILLSLVMVVTVMPAFSEKSQAEETETFVITNPTDNELKAAGYLDIEWSEPSGNVKEYQLYVDGDLLATTTENIYEYYTTEVKMYSVSVTAQLTNGTEVSTPISYFAITKKGLAVNNNMGKNLHPRDMNMGWYYTWGTDAFSYDAYKGIEFVPMIWGAGGEAAGVSKVVQKGYKYLLAYNEPDINHSGGSGIDVNVALNNWSKFLGNDYYLGAPAPSQCPAWDSGTWFRTFMTGIESKYGDYSSIDFIPLHCYYGTYGGVDGANAFLTQVVDGTYEMYGKPIWITEFAPSGWGYSNAYGRQQCKEFMEAVIDGLNERPYVERYSWFTFDTTDETNGAAALWTNATGELTELGEVWVSYGNPEGYTPSELPAPEYTFKQETKNQLLEDTVTISNVQCEDYINAGGVTATASSSVNNGSGADKAIDSEIGSRWESVQKVDPQYIIIDLGQDRNIKQVEINWENARAKNYTIEVSTDGINYTTVATMEGVTGGSHVTDIITFSTMKTARYVKINGTVRTTEYGYSIYDLAIYGTDDTSVNETTKEYQTTQAPVIKPTSIPIPTTRNSTTTKADETSQDSDVSVDPGTSQDADESKNPSSSNDAGTVNNGGANQNTTNVNEQEATTKQVETTEAIMTTAIISDNGVVKVNATKVKKATKKKSAKYAVIKLKKAKSVSGYQIQVSTSSKFKASKTKTKNTKKITYKFKGLKKNKKYYVRARAYKTVNKVKVYGKWSSKKKIKMKK